MKIEKAIEIMEDLITDLPQLSPDDRREAIILSTEATKAYKAGREGWLKFFSPLLPGETKE